MKKELEIELRELYPHVYEDLKSLEDSGGFAIGNGWYEILDKLSNKIEKIITPAHNFKVVQIKEKLASLRFYFDSDIDQSKLFNLTMHSLTESLETCERCGLPGKCVNTKTDWCLTLCDHCADVVEKSKEPIYITVDK